MLNLQSQRCQRSMTQTRRFPISTPAALGVVLYLMFDPNPCECKKDGQHMRGWGTTMLLLRETREMLSYSEDGSW